MKFDSLSDEATGWPHISKVGTVFAFAIPNPEQARLLTLRSTCGRSYLLPFLRQSFAQVRRRS
jgi:hypothetical protein